MRHSRLEPSGQTTLYNDASDPHLSEIMAPPLDLLSQAPTIVRGACPHDCPDTCALEITVQEGRAIKIAGAADHATTRGVLCTKVARYLDRTYSPQRVLHPMKRTGPKGSGAFERITWDEALVDDRRPLSAIASSRDGPQAIVPYSYAGTMGLLQYASMDRRFFHRLGASLLDRTICASAGKAGYAATHRRVRRHGPRALPGRAPDHHLGLATRSSRICTSGLACRKRSAAAPS